MNIKTANRLCELRKKHNLSQEELASMLGVSRQAISKWERSESSPDTDNLIELAKIYNITIDELLNGDEAINLITENKVTNTQFKEDSEEKSHITDDNTIKNNDAKNKKYEIFKDGISGAYVVLSTTTYITLGFLLKNNIGWKYFWFLFLLIPVIPSLCDVFHKRKITAFCYPLAIAAAYCGFSMYYNLWHRLWLLFITIPLFYIIFEPIDKIIAKNTNEEE